MKHDYYVEVTVSGCICVEAESMDMAQERVENAIRNQSDPALIEDIVGMVRQHIESGDVDIGDCFIKMLHPINPQ